MSFRSKLLFFFAIIVVVPMVAVVVVLFSITSESERGQADAQVAEGLRVGLSVYDRARSDAQSQLRQLVKQPDVASALATRDPATIEAAFRAAVQRDPALRSAALYGDGGTAQVSAGASPPFAPATTTATTRDGRKVGTVAVSTTTPQRYAADVAQLTGLDAAVFTNGKRVASTIQAGPPAPRAGSVKIAGTSYRARVATIPTSVGPPVRVTVLAEASQLASSIAGKRAVIAIIVLAALVAALGSSLLVARALQSQVHQFLDAARRVGRGDFSHPVPTHGRDEFAALGSEFNRMSAELAHKIEEVESKRRELEETIRRVGEAFATGLDRAGLVELAVRTAVEACEGQTGRALPLDGRRMNAVHVGSTERDLLDTLEVAERKAFAIRADNVHELIASLEAPAVEMPEQNRPSDGELDGVYSLAIPLRARLGPGTDADYVGVLSIARRERRFTDAERDLFSYLASQAAVSIENANLHETVQRQAVTDELTGLYNVRHFHETLSYEIERSRRFHSEVSLAMLDIDNFKQFNDTYGHQQGDVVLMEVGRVLRELSRDIDEPARYGGEELAVILPQTDLSGAELAAERMRVAIERLVIPRVDGEGELSVTASFGVASLPATATTKEKLIAAADAALYRAKRAGKNRVARAEPAAAAR